MTISIWATQIDRARSAGARQDPKSPLRAGMKRSISDHEVDRLLKDEQPFFLWNHYMDTHGPYEPPEEYRKIFHDKAVSHKDAQASYKRAIQKPESITDEERERLIDLYDAEIRLNDEYIGRFLKFVIYPWVTGKHAHRHHC